MATSLSVDTEHCSHLIGLGYEAALARPAWRRFADEAARTFGCQVAMVEYYDEHHAERSFVATGGLGSDFEQIFGARSRSEEDSYWVGIRDQPPGTVRLGSEIVSPEKMRTTDTYSRLAMPWSLEHFLIGSIATGNGMVAILTLGRTSEARAFEVDDKALISGVLLSHLRRSFTLHRDVDALRDANTMLSAVVNQASYGVVVFNGRGSPVLVNRHASAIFASDNGLILLNGQLQTADLLTNEQLQYSLTTALAVARGEFVAAPPAVLVARHDTARPYRIVHAPLNAGQANSDLPDAGAVVAIIHDERRGTRQSVPTTLRATYGLTRAEVRLCQALLDGLALTEAAVLLDVSRNTAKTHLARIFDKTGVRSQVALLRLLTIGTRA